MGVFFWGGEQIKEVYHHFNLYSNLLALPTTQGKDIVLGFIIIEYSSLMDFGPLGNNNRFIFISGFLKDDILACVET